MEKSESAAVAKMPLPDDMHWASVYNVVLAGVASALHVGKATIALPALQQEFGGSLALLSLAVSVFPLVGVFGGVAAGLSVQRWSDRPLLVAGLALLGVASVAGAAAPNYVWLLATRLVEGLGFLAVVVAAPAILHRVTPHMHRSLAIGLWSTFMPVGIALSLLVGPMLDSWRHIWLASAVPVLLAATGLFVTTPRATPAMSKTPWIVPGLREMLMSRVAVVLALSFTLYGVQFFAVMAFLPIFLMRRVGVSLDMAGVISASVVSVNVVGNLAAGWLLSRGRRPGLLVAVATITMGCSAAIVFHASTPPLLSIALCFAFSAIAGILPATVIATAPTLARSPALVPLGIGWVMQGSYLGQMIGPLLAGAVVGRFGWSGAIGPMLATAIAGATLGMLLLRAD